MKLGAIVLDCGDADVLAGFYAAFLGWEKSVQFSAEDRWVLVTDPNPSRKSMPLVFQQVVDYQPPVWPPVAGRQQQMAHLDFYVDSVEEMEQMVRHAIDCGASRPDTTFSDDWQVLLDPAGHPFCLIPLPS